MHGRPLINATRRASMQYTGIDLDPVMFIRYGKHPLKEATSSRCKPVLQLYSRSGIQPTSLHSTSVMSGRFEQHLHIPVQKAYSVAKNNDQIGIARRHVHPVLRHGIVR